MTSLTLGAKFFIVARGTLDVVSCYPQQGEGYTAPILF